MTWYSQISASCHPSRTLVRLLSNSPVSTWTLQKGGKQTHTTPLVIHPDDNARCFGMLLLRLLVAVPLILARDRLPAGRLCLVVFALLELLQSLLAGVALRIVPVALHRMVVARPSFPTRPRVLCAFLRRVR